MQVIDERLLQLLKQYDKPGPRYTSYPTAPVFSSEYTDKRFEIDVIHNNHENASPLSLYVHVPFCDSLCYFCGCTTVITRNREHIREYCSSIKKEISRMSAYVLNDRPVTQMHWGGGTPSYLQPEEIDDLGRFIEDRFSFAPGAEVSVEIDPRELTRGHLEAFRNRGVNRISLGVQDFNERVQRAVNRVQPESITVQAIEWARELGIGSINIDLIYGLPLQSVGSFQKTLDRVVELSPSRIAVFSFAYVPWMKSHQKLLHREDLPSAETKLQLLKATIETLTSAGYEYVGMDHFAKPGDELAVAQRDKKLHRNFQGYSTNAGANLYGFGMSAISHFGSVYAQNAKTLAEYHKAVAAGKFPTAVGYRMSKDDLIRKFVIMRLMCDLEVDKTEVEGLFGVMFDEYFDASLDELQQFVQEGLVRLTLDRVKVEPDGRLFLRNIAMCFDAYVKKLGREKPIFSRTV